MKKVALLSLGLASLVFATASCTPKLAERSIGEDEQEWSNYITGMYPGWEQPKTLPPAVTVSSEKVPLQYRGDSEMDPFETDDTQLTGIDDLTEFDGGDDVEIIIGEEDDISTTDEPLVDARTEYEPVYSDYVVAKNDTLSGIAKKLYGNGNKYLHIYEANKDVITDANKLKPGMKLRIPEL